jgi:hypothetical protein
MTQVDQQENEKENLIHSLQSDFQIEKDKILLEKNRLLEQAQDLKVCLCYDLLVSPVQERNLVQFQQISQLKEREQELQVLASPSSALTVDRDNLI